MAVVYYFLIKNQVSIFNDLEDALYIVIIEEFMKNKESLGSPKEQEGDVYNFAV